MSNQLISLILKEMTNNIKYTKIKVKMIKELL